MDGNGRWAQQRRRPHSFGHRAGVAAIKRVMYACEELGIEVLTVYAFSTENWSRPQGEVRSLMRLFQSTLRREFDELHARGIRILVSGRIAEMSLRMRHQIADAMAATAGNRRGVLNVCLNYGGRAELVDAVKKVVADGLTVDQIDEGAIEGRLYQPQLPPPDLVIRTAGEQRLSNFLLWQTAYSELHFTDVLWPDFGRDQLAAAVADFRHRVRRFGGRPDAAPTETQDGSLSGSPARLREA